MISHLNMNPRVVSQGDVVVPEVCCGLRESHVIDVDGEVLAGADLDVANAVKVDSEKKGKIFCFCSQLIN